MSIGTKISKRLGLDFDDVSEAVPTTRIHYKILLELPILFFCIVIYRLIEFYNRFVPYIG